MKKFEYYRKKPSYLGQNLGKVKFLSNRAISEKKGYIPF
jgi:hypothetical protein